MGIPALALRERHVRRSSKIPTRNRLTRRFYCAFVKFLSAEAMRDSYVADVAVFSCT